MQFKQVRSYIFIKSNCIAIGLVSSSAGSGQLRYLCWDMLSSLFFLLVCGRRSWTDIGVLATSLCFVGTPEDKGWSFLHLSGGRVSIDCGEFRA